MKRSKVCSNNKSNNKELYFFLTKFVGLDFVVELHVLVFAHSLKPQNVALFDIFFTLIYFNNHLLPPPTLSKYTKIQDCNLII